MFEIGDQVRVKGIEGPLMTVTGTTRIVSSLDDLLSAEEEPWITAIWFVNGKEHKTSHDPSVFERAEE